MLDFDTLKNLHMTEPAIFEILRNKLIDRLIRKYSKTEQELWIKRGSWRKIDLEIMKYKNPMMRVLIAARKMEEKYMELNRLLNKVT